MTYNYVCRDQEFGIIDLRTEELPNNVKTTSKIFAVLEKIMLVFAVVDGGVFLLIAIFESDLLCFVLGLLAGGLLYGFSRLFNWFGKRVVNRYLAKRSEIEKMIEHGEIDIYVV